MQVAAAVGGPLLLRLITGQPAPWRLWLCTVLLALAGALIIVSGPALQPPVHRPRSQQIFRAVFVNDHLHESDIFAPTLIPFSISVFLGAWWGCRCRQLLVTDTLQGGRAECCRASGCA